MITRRDVLRAGVVLPMASSVGTAMAQTTSGNTSLGNASVGNTWLYSDQRGPGAFRDDGDGHWTEITPTGAQWFFREVNRKDNFTELRDDGRGMWVRLYANQAVWRQEAETVWHRWLAGEWVSQDALPPLIDYSIRLAYFIPSDRAPTAYYEEKMAVLASFVSEIYNQSLQRRGFKARSLPFRTRSGKLAVDLIRAPKPAAYYNNAPNYVHNALDHWERIVADVPVAVGVPQKHLLLVLAETYGAEPSPVEWPGTVAKGVRYSQSGGIGVFSSWILRDEFCARSLPLQRKLIFDATPIRGRTAMGYGKPDSPRHHFIEDGFGAVTHELGHALGLPHDTRRDAHDIMGQGFRVIRWNFADPPQPENGGVFSDDNCRILLSSRYLGTDLEVSDFRRPDVLIRIVDAKFDKRRASVTVEVDASDDRGLRAVLLYCVQQDSVVGGRWLAGTRQTFRQELAIDPAISAGQVTIEATVTNIGGNYAARRASWPA